MLSSLCEWILFSLKFLTLLPDDTRRGPRMLSFCHRSQFSGVCLLPRSCLTEFTLQALAWGLLVRSHGPQLTFKGREVALALMSEPPRSAPASDLLPWPVLKLSLSLQVAQTERVFTSARRKYVERKREFTGPTVEEGRPFLKEQ